MNFLEFIGFLIALVALIVSAGRKVSEERERRSDPEGYARRVEKERQRADEEYKELLGALGIELEEEVERPPPIPQMSEPPANPKMAVATPIRQEPSSKRRLSKDFEFHSSIEDRTPSSSIENRELEISVGKRFGQGYGEQLVSESLRGGVTATSRVKQRRAPIKKMFDQLHSKRNLILGRELLAPPRALQPWEDDPMGLG